jgi:hypothetical protein
MLKQQTVFEKKKWQQAIITLKARIIFLFVY